MGLFSKLFGSTNASLESYLEQNPIIIDVRSKQEYNSGHVAKSKNIPLQTIENSIEQIKGYDKPVILCCASGMRSGQATRILKQHSIDCINGGSWNKVDSLITAQ